MKEVARKETRDAAGMVTDAYHYIVQHAQPYKTAVVFDIQSDCKSECYLQQSIYLRDSIEAEFSLWSPHAVITPDTDNAFPDKTVATPPFSSNYAQGTHPSTNTCTA